MNIISLNFIWFIIIIYTANYIINNKYRYVILLLASYYFYWQFGLNSFATLILITIIAYMGSYYINKFKNKFALIIVISLVLLPMAVGKYLSFILGLINPGEHIHIIAALGVSFYTFMSISYIVDIYNRKIDLEKNILKVALYLSFFPHILQGPITKARDFIPQISVKYSYNEDRTIRALYQVGGGIIQKFWIADVFAQVVNPVFSDPFVYNSPQLIIVIFLYSIQIYIDFLAYSNIAIGTAKLLGYDLHINFNTPYFAKSTADFWRRWHISLSNWLKDYIYIPLGGNRRGTFRKNINIMIVFFISGIWHGTGVTFIVWGLLHGIYHVIGDITKNIRARIKSLLLVKEGSRTENWLQIVTVFSLVSFAWIFFRANDVWDALFIIKTIFSLDGFEGLYKNLPSIILEVISSRLLLAKVVLAIIILTISSYISNKVNYEKYVNQTPQIIRYMLAAIVMFFVAFALVSTGLQPDNQFIYFKF